MRKILAMMIVSVFMAAGLAYAEESVKLGYVDMRKAMSECKAGKSATDKLQKSVKEKQIKVDEEKKKLEAMQAEYEKKGSSLSDKEKQTRQKEFQEKIQAYQNMVNEARKEVNEKEAEYTKKILGDMKKVIADIAKTDNYTIIIEKIENSVLYAKDGLDLTKKVIEKMDAQK